MGVFGRASDWVRHLKSGLWQWEAELRGAKMLGPVTFLGRPILTMQPGSSIVFGGNNIVFSDARCNDLGISQPSVFRTLKPSSRLEIGKGVGISSASICALSTITIGDETLVGAGAAIFDDDFHRPVGPFEWDHSRSGTSRPISIGRGCFIGARAIILRGVTIGDRAAVAAGAVVTKSVPSGAVAYGNPARIVPWFAAEAAAKEVEQRRTQS